MSLLALSSITGMAMAGQAFPHAWEEALQARDATRVAALMRQSGGTLPRDAHGFTPLHRAPALEADRSEAPMFQALLDGGADIHAVGRWGITPLHSAAAAGCVPCVRALLRAGASPMVRREDGGTPLHRASAAVQALLRDAGADVGARDLQGRTPLHTAAERTPELLGVGLNVTDNAGFTPLHVAALAGSESSVRWLLEQGADTTLRSTALYEHREGVLAAEFDPVIPFPAGQRAYDLARAQYDRTKWATSRYTRTMELLDKATPRRGLFSR